MIQCLSNVAQNFAQNKNLPDRDFAKKLDLHTGLQSLQKLLDLYGEISAI